MKIIKTNCIILKKKEMREADLQVTLFSKEYGKIMATAYGIRKSKKRNIVSLNPLNKVEITLLDMTDENGNFFDKLVEILSFIDILPYIKKGYKYYVVLSFLRRIMIEHGIYDIEEIISILIKEKKENKKKYKEIMTILKTNSDISEIQEKFESYTVFLKKMVIIFENFINKNLQVELKVKKFIMEEFYGN